MIYVSKYLGMLNYKLVDSETGFEKIVYLGDDGYLCKGEPYPMEEVLGYFGGRKVCVVPKQLVTLLRYIDWIDIGEYSEDGFPLTIDKSKHNILIELSWSEHVLSVLDIILDLSSQADFSKMLDEGMFVTKYGGYRVKIKLCGDYKAVILKLVTLMREK